MRNATGKESRHYDEQELRLIAAETAENEKIPGWITRALMAQVEDSAE